MKLSMKCITCIIRDSTCIAYVIHKNRGKHNSSVTYSNWYVVTDGYNMDSIPQWSYRWTVTTCIIRNSLVYTVCLYLCSLINVWSDCTLASGMYTDQWYGSSQSCRTLSDNSSECLVNRNTSIWGAGQEWWK